MANPQIVIINPQISNLQTSINAQRDFAEFICGPPTFAPNCELYIQVVHNSCIILGQLEGATMQSFLALSNIKYFEYTPDLAYTMTQNAIFLTAFLKMD